MMDAIEVRCNASCRKTSPSFCALRKRKTLNIKIVFYALLSLAIHMY